MYSSYQWLSPLKDMSHVPSVQISSEDLYRSRIVQNVTFRPSKDQKPISEHKVAHSFEEIVGGLKKTAVPCSHDQLSWKKQAVGPKDISRFLSISKNVNIRILSNHTHPQTNVFVKSGTPEEQLIIKTIQMEVIEEPVEVVEEPVEILEEPMDLPFGPYMFHFDTGKAPKLVRLPNDSHFAMVKEKDLIHDPLQFYTKKTGYEVVSTRILSEVEELFLKSKTWHSLGGKIRLLEFKSVHERNEASGNCEFVSHIYENARLFRKRYYRSFSALVKFEMSWQMAQVHKFKGDLLEAAGRQCYSITQVSECQFLVVFDIREVGKQAVRKMKNRYPHYDITPLHRRTVTVYRDIRCAFNDAIRVRSEELIRRQAPGRIVEEWRDGEEIGCIGVEGTSEEFVKREVELLEKMLRPIIIEEAPELFFGIGEAYVRDCAERFEVLVDVDKYRNQLYVFGSSAAIVVHEIKQYMKVGLEVELNIPIRLPFFNCPGVFAGNTARDIRLALGASCRIKDGTFQFVGSLDAYKKLTAGLEEVSESYLQHFQPSSPTCSVCRDKTGPEEDFHKPECGHALCRDCCNGKIKVSIESKSFKIVCDQEGCQRVWTPKEIIRVILGDNRRIRALDGEKLEKFLMAAKRSILDTKDLKPCSKPGCEMIRIRDPTMIKKECEQCEAKYCGACLCDYHEGMSCEQALMKPEDRSLLLFIEANENTQFRLVRCPGCSILVQRASGCPHIVCTACSVHFCFTCRFQAADDQTIYDHIRISHPDPELNVFEFVDVQPFMGDRLHLHILGYDSDEDD